MKLIKCNIDGNERWLCDGVLINDQFNLATLLKQTKFNVKSYIESMLNGNESVDLGNCKILAPIDKGHEVWASGLNYQRSFEAKKEDIDKNIYDHLYQAERPELYTKSIGWRVVPHGEGIRVRRDSEHSMVDPELVLIINANMEIIGYTAGHDIGSLDIEADNPLYLPQSKFFDGSCALGPEIVIASSEEMQDLNIKMTIERAGKVIFQEENSTSNLKRSCENLVSHLASELSFPEGTLIMTGAAVVPDKNFKIVLGDKIETTVGDVTIINTVV